MPQNIVGDRVESQEISRVDDGMVRKLSRHVLEPGDIVYPRRGDLDKTGFNNRGGIGLVMWNWLY